MEAIKALAKILTNILTALYEPFGFSLLLSFLATITVRPHKEKINISKEIINKTRGAEAPYAAQIFTHLSVVSSRQHLYGRLRCEEATLDRRNRPNEDK